MRGTWSYASILRSDPGGWQTMDREPTFDHRTALESQIIGRARLLVGRRLGDIATTSWVAEALRGKAEVGHAIEASFGIPKNSRAEADFPGAGIELKAVPVVRGPSALRIKERTFLMMINYQHLVEETWATAKVRSKMKILFVFYEHLLGRPKAEFPILAIDLFEPDARLEKLLRADWERVQAIVRHGNAHLLSESDGRIMTPSTKSATSKSRTPQPFSTIPAKPRGFALKPSFTLERFRLATASAPPSESLIETLGMRRVDTFEEQLIRRFQPYVRMTVAEAARSLRVPASGNKSYAAGVVRRAFGVGERSRIKEFEEMGLTLRISRVGPGLLPYEALSFPAFRYRELVEERWEESELLSQVGYILFVPVHGRTKATPQEDCVLGEPVFWRPSADDLELIRREWELYRLEIERGKALELTPASETVALHVRPHARNKADTHDAPIVGPVVKKSFWFNRPFVQTILRGAR
jgi:DNA mismatch repair endonuclease MutH